VADPAATPAWSARLCATRSRACMTRGGTSALPNAPGPNVRLPLAPAAAGNRCAAPALSDDQLDFPCYRPRTGYRPATGTGTGNRGRHPPARPLALHEEGRVSNRMNLNLITGVFGVLDRHGYARGDNEHAGRPSPSSATWPASMKAPRTTRADHRRRLKRDRTGMCAERADQSRPDCGWRLRAAQALGCSWSSGSFQARRLPGYTPAIWPICSSTPSSEQSSATCSTNSVPRHQPSSHRGRPAIWPRTSSCASTTPSLAPGFSLAVRGAASRNDEDARSRRGTSPGSLRRSGRDHRQASSASDGCAGSRASMSSSSTTRTYAGPTVVVPDERACDGRGPLGQRQPRALVPRPATARRRA
jgi:hypothetical protein